jgi:stage II sporulation protein D
VNDKLELQPRADEPRVAVGLMSNATTAAFTLRGDFAAGDQLFAAGDWQVRAANNRIELFDAAGHGTGTFAELQLRPLEPASTFIVRDVTIGINFHWQRQQDLEFQGALRIKVAADGRLLVINEVPIETYLTSVISSEMSAAAHPDLLRAHAVVARSWLLAQLKEWKQPRRKFEPQLVTVNGEQQLIRWYDQENHADFDVCADDHCQRYQGVTKVSTPAARAAVQATGGQVLSYDGTLCDARYSKSCGGMTEEFAAAWDDVPVDYLAVSYDGENFPAEFALPLSDEANAEAWIRATPPAFCNAPDPHVLSKILPDFDQETPDFYRWRVTIAQAELQELLQRKLGVEFGAIQRLEAVERGASGRIVKLRIVGERATLVIGKELEIRRALSPSHLYSSAFVVETERTANGAPASFTLLGAGWGHGVGLCQIGAALMAERGYDFQQIMAHYYRGARLYQLYEPHVRLR